MTILKQIFRFLGHQEIFRFGLRDRLIRAFHHPDKAKSEEFTVPFFGDIYRGNFATFLDWNVFYYGAYAGEELRLIKEVLELIPDPVVFDVGANVGQHTLFMARHSQCVYAFEPFKNVSEKVQDKLSENKVRNVVLCEFGLGEIEAEKDFYPPDSANTGTGSFLFRETTAKPLKLKIRKGDTFVGEKHLKKLDFIKMDVEGFEPVALGGLKKTLEKYRPIVFFEWSKRSRLAGGAKKPADFFPEDYLIKQFIPETVIFSLFRQPAYRLSSADEKAADGNLLAIPKEKNEKIIASNASSAFARRLKESVSPISFNQKNRNLEGAWQR